jgi:hypothetical protein
MRRLGRVIGQCEALTPAPNVAEKNRTKGRSPDCGFLEPEGPLGPEAYTDLLYDVFLALLRLAPCHGRRGALQ